MKLKKILLIDGNPNPESLCASISSAYVRGAEDQGYTIVRLNLRDLKFDPVLHYGYSKKKTQIFEEDLTKAQQYIKDCDHLVIVSPVWWGSVPALLKGFLDRVLLSGFAFRFNPKTGMPTRLLTGRTASVIYSQGSPWILSFFMGNTLWSMLKNYVLRFCGFSNLKKHQISNAKNIGEKRMNKIMNQIYTMGKNGF